MRFCWRAAQIIVLLLGCALLCAAACASLPAAICRVRRTQRRGKPAPIAARIFPIASDARLAGDAKQTRFMLDLDKTIPFRAFALADPYRVVVDIPQVNFSFVREPAPTARADQGIPLRPGDARRLADRVRSDRPAKIANSYVLDAANGQPPRLGARTRGGRPRDFRAVAAVRQPAADAEARRSADVKETAAPRSANVDRRRQSRAGACRIRGR